VVKQKSIQWTDNKVITTPQHSTQYIDKKYIKRLNHKGLVYKLEPNQRVSLLTPKLASNSLKNYEFQQIETLVEFHSFTLSPFIFIPSNTNYA
jgi:hypothetical protein